MAEAVFTETFECRTRPYLLLQDPEFNVGSGATIVDLHGSGSWPEEHVLVTGARTLAAVGATIVVPQAGIPFRLFADSPVGWAWNVPGSPLFGELDARDEPDDLAFIDALITQLVSQHGVDPRRIHVRGFSGGARLAAHLMVAFSSRLASVCCVGGLRFVEGAVAPLPPLQAIHGRLDALNPYEGDGGPRWGESVEAAAAHWAVASGCAEEPRRRSRSDGVQEIRYHDGENFAAVRLLVVGDAAHSWPGTTLAEHIARFGASGTFIASDAHWDFVREIEHRAGRTT